MCLFQPHEIVPVGAGVPGASMALPTSGTVGQLFIICRFPGAGCHQVRIYFMNKLDRGKIPYANN